MAQKSVTHRRVKKTNTPTEYAQALLISQGAFGIPATTDDSFKNTTKMFSIVALSPVSAEGLFVCNSVDLTWLLTNI